MAYLNYVEKESIPIKRPYTYKLASYEEVRQLNNYESLIKEVATFYETNLSNTKIDYVFVEEGAIKVLPVKYKQENFPHLTGINFDLKTAKEKYEVLKNGNNDSPIIIERDGSTFKKLDVLHKIPDLIKADTSVLTQLKDVKQAKNIGFSRGIKDSDNELLIALQNFQPEFYTPKSLLNIKDRNIYEDVPENTVLGVFAEKNIKNGVKIEPISLNKDSLNNISITTEMLIAMKKYADELGKSKTQNQDKDSEKEKLKTQYQQYLAQRGLDR